MPTNSFLFVCLLICLLILPGKTVSEMIYTVSGGTLNPTHSLTISLMSLLVAIIYLVVCYTDLLTFYYLDIQNEVEVCGRPNIYCNDRNR